MKRKILIFSIVAMLIAMLVILTGCGNKSSNTNSDSKQNTTDVGKLDLEVEAISDFSEELAKIKKNGKWGYIDKKGNIVIDCIYDDAKDFSEGLAVVKKDGKCGYINNKGEVVIDFKYDLADSFSFGYGVGYIGRSKNIVIDKSGNEIINKSYSMMFGPISENLFIVVADDVLKGYAIVDKDENVIIDGIAQAGTKVDGYIPVKQVAEHGNFWDDGKWGFIDENGKLVIDYQYDFAGSFVDGLAGVVKDGNIGYINKNNEFVIEAKYPYKDNTAVRDYSCGLVRGYDTDKNTFFDTEGKKVFSVEYNSVTSFVEDRAECEKNNKYGFIDKNGKEVIDCKYAHVFDFSNGLAKVYSDEYVNFEFIDKNGKTILAGKIVEEGTSKSLSTNESDVTISSSNSTNTNSSNSSNNNSSSSNSNNTSNIAESNSSKTSTSNSSSSSSKSTTADGIKVGSSIVKYGTYNGDAAATGDTLVLKADGTCIYNGTSGKYSVGKHDFAQDSSSKGSEKDCIIIDVEYKYYYYPYNETTLTDGGAFDFVYSGN